MKRLLLLSTLIATPCLAHDDSPLAAPDPFASAKDGLYTCYHVGATVRCDPVMRQAAGPDAQLHQSCVARANAKALSNQYILDQFMRQCEGHPR